MRLHHGWTEYSSEAGPVRAWLSRPAPASGSLPGVVVIQEVWGVDLHLRDVADRIATAGYVALAPDLYSLGGRATALSPERIDAAKTFIDNLPPERSVAILGDAKHRAEALGQLPGGEGAQVDETLQMLFGGHRDLAANIRALRAGVRFLKGHDACEGGTLGAIGFCMGGSMSALLASQEPDLGAACVFYGASPPSEQAQSIQCPLRGFYGEDDSGIAAGLPAFEAALQQAEVDYELLVYPATPHAFFNDTRPSYRVDAARHAWAQTLAFFADHLSVTRYRDRHPGGMVEG